MLVEYCISMLEVALIRPDLTCLRVHVQEILGSAGDRLQDHLEVLGVVGKGALLQDVACLREHLLQVNKQVVHLLGGSRNKITEARYCSKFSTDFLDLHLAFENYFLQRYLAVRYWTKTKNIPEVSQKYDGREEFFRMPF